MKAIRDTLKRIDNFLLSRFPEEWVAVGSEGLNIGLSSLLSFLFLYLLLLFFSGEAGYFFAALGVAYLAKLAIDMGRTELILREVMERAYPFSAYVNFLFLTTLLSSAAGAIGVGRWDVFFLLSATIFTGGMASVYHRMGEYTKFQAIQLFYNVGRVILTIGAYFLNLPLYLSFSLLWLPLIPLLRYISPTVVVEEVAKGWQTKGEGTSLRLYDLFFTLSTSADSYALYLLLGPSAVSTYNGIVLIPRKMATLFQRLFSSLAGVWARGGEPTKGIKVIVTLLIPSLIILSLLSPKLILGWLPPLPQVLWVVALFSSIVPALASLGATKFFVERRYRELGKYAGLSILLLLIAWGTLYTFTSMLPEVAFLTIFFTLSNLSALPLALQGVKAILSYRTTKP